jgi:hypothetical protein
MALKEMRGFTRKPEYRMRTSACIDDMTFGRGNRSVLIYIEHTQAATEKQSGKPR